MARARTVLSAVVVIVALAGATILTLIYPGPSLLKLIGWFVLFATMQVPAIAFASAGKHGVIRIADRDSA